MGVDAYEVSWSFRAEALDLTHFGGRLGYAAFGKARWTRSNSSGDMYESVECRRCRL